MLTEYEKRKPGRPPRPCRHPPAVVEYVAATRDTPEHLRCKSCGVWLATRTAAAPAPSAGQRSRDPRRG